LGTCSLHTIAQSKPRFNTSSPSPASGPLRYSLALLNTNAPP